MMSERVSASAAQPAATATQPAAPASSGHGDLEAVLVLRRRSHYQALDLGLALVQRFPAPLVLSWFLPAFFTFLVLLPFLAQSPGWLLLVLWWLKPLFDRFALIWLSRAVFSQQLTLRQLFFDSKRTWSKQLFAQLSWRRLSFTRSFDQPVSLLEGLQGNVRASRLAVLHRNGSSEALWLTVIWSHMEWLIGLGALMVALMFIPDLEAERLGFAGDGFEMLATLFELEQLAWALVVGWFIGAVFSGPFYAAGGFSLYLNRRCQLEGWDIEVGFRRLGQRLSAQHVPAVQAPL